MALKDLGFLAWKNDLANLETQTGAKWEKAIDDETTRFKAALRPLKGSIDSFKRILKGSSNESPWHYKGWKVSSVGFSPEQLWLKGTHVSCKVWDADVCKGYFAGAVQDSAGFERFNVVVYKGTHHVATLQKTGPQVAWLSGTELLVYLGSSSDLRYDSVHTWCPETKATTLLYETHDPTENLELGRAEDGSVYVLVKDFVSVRLGFVDVDRITWEQFPSPVHDIAVIARDSWVLNNAFPPFPKDSIVESVSRKGGFAITREYGIRTVWQLASGKPKQMITVWGQVSFDSRDPYTLTVADVRYESYTVKTSKKGEWKLSSPDPHPYLFSRYTDVAPVFTVLPRLGIRGLLITAYGAYGTPTRIGSLVPRWRPLLESGWAIATVCVPGSGDHDNAWKTAGQRLGRGESIRVFTETIRRLQEELGITASCTALHGRSAGGLLCTATALATPLLVGALYVESPYVDILRTISSPSLPLTLLETKEFGIGSNPTNILATGAWSPMEKIPVGGVPELFVVARSDTSDLEVYPYEVVKWIQRMRGPHTDNTKLLYVGSGKGHFTTTTQSRAEDLALLENWLDTFPGVSLDKKNAPRRTLCQSQNFGMSSNGKCNKIKKFSPTGRILTSPPASTKNRRYKYNTMPGMSHKNHKNHNNLTRKNRKDRKNKGNGNKNGTLMGGRRHRKGSKGRKHTRRH